MRPLYEWNDGVNDNVADGNKRSNSCFCIIIKVSFLFVDRVSFSRFYQVQDEMLKLKNVSEFFLVSVNIRDKMQFSYTFLLCCVRLYCILWSCVAFWLVTRISV